MSMISKKAAFAAGVVDFDALAKFNRNPYGDHRKAEPKRFFVCRGGPWDGEQVLLDPLNGNCSTLVVRIGEQVGRYKALGYASVEWEAA